MVLSAVRVNALKQPTKYAVIFVHGLGDSGAGWSFLADEAKKVSQTESSEFYGKFNNVRFIFPNAPTCPVTANYGASMPSWFDIFSFGNPSDTREDTKGFLQSVATINSFIDELTQESGIQPENIVLGGFSQGAALSLASSALLNKKIGGIISLSGFLRVKDEILKKVKECNGAENLANFNTPILHCHGDVDPVIDYQYGVLTKDFFKQSLLYPNYKFLKFRGLGHSASPEELNEVFKFLAKAFS